MSLSIYKEITGRDSPTKSDVEFEKEKVLYLLCLAKRENINFLEIDSLLFAVRHWLEEEGFSIDKKDVLIKKCYNDNDFNRCQCFDCSHVGKKTGKTCWLISW